MPLGLGVLSSWPFEPVVLIAVELAAVLYVIGGIGLSHRHGSPGRWRVAAFWLGLLAILVALQSPIEMLARQLFWVHMVQHLLLMVVAAPLLALASPWTRMWRALPLRLRRSVARPLFLYPRLAWLRALYQQVSRPSVIWVLSAANLWLWHLPPMYDLTLSNHLVHHLEHTLFLVLGIAFWAHLIDQRPFRAPLGTLARAGYVFLAMVQSWGLAGVLSFATVPFYSYALLPSRPGGISALTDQQLGGGMMWVPGAISYSIALIVFLFQWLAEEDRRGEVGPEGRPRDLEIQVVRAAGRGGPARSALKVRDDDGTGPLTSGSGRMGSKDPVGISGPTSWMSGRPQRGQAHGG